LDDRPASLILEFLNGLTRGDYTQAGSRAARVTQSPGGKSEEQGSDSRIL